MPVTITLKNIPDAVYQQLKHAAEAHHRSLNSEAIVCLETALLPRKHGAQERLDRARALRSALTGMSFQAADIDMQKHEGRA